MSDIFKIRQIFISIRNYDGTQTNRRKNLSSPFARKSNLRIINILGQEFLKSGSGRKSLSKRHRPKTGRAARWELNQFLSPPAIVFFGSAKHYPISENSDRIRKMSIQFLKNKIGSEVG